MFVPRFQLSVGPVHLSPPWGGPCLCSRPPTLGGGRCSDLEQVLCPGPPGSAWPAVWSLLCLPQPLSCIGVGAWGRKVTHSYPEAAVFTQVAWGGGPVSFMSPSLAWSPLSPSLSKSSPPLYRLGSPSFSSNPSPTYMLSSMKEFPGSLVIRTLRFHHQDCGFNPWLGN